MLQVLVALSLSITREPKEQNHVEEGNSEIFSFPAADNPQGVPSGPSAYARGWLAWNVANLGPHIANCLLIAYDLVPGNNKRASCGTPKENRMKFPDMSFNRHTKCYNVL